MTLRPSSTRIRGEGAGVESRVDKSLALLVEQMRFDAAERDSRMMEIRAVRAGNMSYLAPDIFNDQWPRPVIANLIDSSARDLSEVVAQLPALNCSSGGMKSEADKRRASVKNKAGFNYWNLSKLEIQMKRGADRFLSYGFIPMYVEPDFVRQTPIIRIEDPYGAYFQNDRWGETVRYVRVWQEKALALADKFPDLEYLIRYRDGRDCGSEFIEVVRYHDKNECIIYLPSRGNLVLSHYPNLISRCAVQVGERPSLDDESRGQWDQVIYVQYARQALTMMSLDATHKAVNAPIILPRDATSIEFGKDEIIRSDGQPRRLALELPSTAFAFDQKLQNEQMLGQRTPEGRFGQIDAQVVTGRGVQALMGGFDTQIRTAQDILGETLAVSTENAFELDQKLWPDVRKKISGTINGETFEVSYTPAVDIAGNYSCDVTYGLAGGQAPNAAVVMMLQLLGAELIDKDTIRRNLPFPMDAEQMARNVDVEKLRNASLQGTQALAQAIGPVIMQGGDPLAILNAVAQVTKGRANGRPLEDLMLEAFKPPEPPPQEAAPEAPPTEQDLAAQQAGQLPPGIGPEGRATGVAAGQQGSPPGGLADLQNFVARLRGNGQATSDVSTTRRVATGG